MTHTSALFLCMNSHEGPPEMSAGKSLDPAEMDCDSCCFRETLDEAPNQMLHIQNVFEGCRARKERSHWQACRDAVKCSEKKRKAASQNLSAE